MSLFSNHTLSLTSLTIRECLGCDNVTVTFSKSDNVHVLIYNAFYAPPKDQPAVTPVAQAILLLTSHIYADAHLENAPFLKTGNGWIVLCFEMIPEGSANGGEAAAEEDEESDLEMDPCTSQQALERMRQREERKERRQREAARKAHQSNSIQIYAKRRFDELAYLDKVFVEIDEGELEMMTVKDFIDQFFVNPNHSQTFLGKAHEKYGGNWLNVIRSDRNDTSHFTDSDSPFLNFVKLFDRSAVKPHDLTCQVGKLYLEVNEKVWVQERRFVLNLFNQVRRIFEFITNSQHTVWFVLPDRQMKDTRMPMTLDDLDFSEVRYSIRATSDNTDVSCTDSNHSLKDILMVSFQLAFASNVRQSVVVLSHMEILSEYMTMQYISAQYMNDLFMEPNEPQWICHSYLQRIVNMAQFLNAIVLIEFPSAFTLLSGGRQLLKCYQRQVAEECVWDLFEDISKEDNFSVNNMKKHVDLQNHTE
ncbi:protein ORD [Drosophila bipectinata]|uniref:protein ORD n=1 Tax=Drosophila bipectinata TaxID=42026 RepID=UPI001C899267|nr:protein ORD [Drosophila bipectinata]XP_017096516.2 protein ORD [Drosophila bipectinata]